MRTLRAIPNAVTVTRPFLAALVIALFAQRQFAAGLVLFPLLAGADVLDGHLARRLHATTELGALLDPICDKLVAMGFFTFFLATGSCPIWFVAFLLTTYLLQVAGYLALRPSDEPGPPPVPSSLARANAALQLTWIGVVLTDVVLRDQFPRNFQFSPAFHLAGYTLLAAAQMVVFFRYFVRFRHALLAEPHATPA